MEQPQDVLVLQPTLFVDDLWAGSNRSPELEAILQEALEKAAATAKSLASPPPSVPAPRSAPAPPKTPPTPQPSKKERKKAAKSIPALGDDVAGDEGAWKPLSVSMADWLEDEDAESLNIQNTPITQNIGQQAIEAAQAGRLDVATGRFVRAILKSGGDAAGYGNLATALTDWSMALFRGQTAAGKVSEEAILGVLQVANAATDIALLLSPYNPHLIETQKRIAQVGHSLVPGTCSMHGCGARFPAEEAVTKTLGRQERAVSNALKEALSAHWGEDGGPPRADSHRYLLLGPIKQLCAEPAMLKVTVHRQDPRGAAPDGYDPVSRRPYWVRWLSSIRRALTIFRICGAVVLDGVVPSSIATNVLAELEPVQQSLTEHYEACGGRRNCSWEMVYNPVTPGARRYHGRVPLRSPFTDEALIWPNSLKEVLISGFNGNRQLEIGRFSYVTSLPGLSESGVKGTAGYQPAGKTRQALSLPHSFTLTNLKSPWVEQSLRWTKIGTRMSTSRTSFLAAPDRSKKPMHLSLSKTTPS